MWFPLRVHSGDRTLHSTPFEPLERFNEVAAAEAWLRRGAELTAPEPSLEPPSLVGGLGLELGGGGSEPAAVFGRFVVFGGGDILVLVFGYDMFIHISKFLRVSWSMFAFFFFFAEVGRLAYGWAWVCVLLACLPACLPACLLAGWLAGLLACLFLLSVLLCFVFLLLCFFVSLFLCFFVCQHDDHLPHFFRQRTHTHTPKQLTLHSKASIVTATIHFKLFL